MHESGSGDAASRIAGFGPKIFIGNRDLELGVLKMELLQISLKMPWSRQVEN